MHDFFPYGKRNWYPHLKPADIELWQRFIDKFPEAYDEVQYDYGVGSPPPFNPIVNEETMGSIDELYRHKIDVVGYKMGKLDIIELKPRAGFSAIGQVKGYRALYERDENPKTSPRAVIITDQMSQDVLEVAAKEGVEIILV